MKFYTYIIQFIDSFYYYGSRVSKINPEEDVYWGSPYTHKDKWLTTMYSKRILCVYDTFEEMFQAEMDLIKSAYKIDPFCLNQNCNGAINMTEEIKQKISESKIGEKNPFYGRKHSPETRQKMSENRRGKKMSDETKQKISESKLGQQLSPEHKKKLSESKSGENNPWYGKKRPPEFGQKIREANLRRSHGS